MNIKRKLASQIRAIRHYAKALRVNLDVGAQFWVDHGHAAKWAAYWVAHNEGDGK